MEGDGDLGFDIFPFSRSFALLWILSPSLSLFVFPKDQCLNLYVSCTCLCVMRYAFNLLRSYFLPGLVNQGTVSVLGCSRSRLDMLSRQKDLSLFIYSSFPNPKRDPKRWRR